jgi:protein-L-isoaspartate(D-aspartate) O-methyltransferase
VALADPGAEQLAAEARAALVRGLRQRGVLHSDAVARAFLTVPRHRLLERFWARRRELTPGEGVEGAFAGAGELVEYHLDPGRPDPSAVRAAYADDALMTRWQGGRPTSSTSQPGLMAEMLELLDLHPGERVLEIGTGTGYNAALLSELIGDQELVTTIDIDAAVVDQAARLLEAAGYGRITVLAADGFDGCAGGAPYDKVVATVGCTDLSPSWVDQLRPGGLLVVPLEHGGAQPLVRAARQGGGAVGRAVSCAGFVPIQGRLAGTSPWRQQAPSSPGAMRRSPGLRRSLGAPLASKLPTASFEEEGSRRAWDLHYCLALWDRRVGSLLTLFGEEGEWASLELSTKQVVVSGGAEALAADLEALSERWVRLGGPGMADFVSEFRPIGAAEPGRAPAPLGTASHVHAAGGPWVVERVAFRQIVWLPAVTRSE